MNKIITKNQLLCMQKITFHRVYKYFSGIRAKSCTKLRMAPLFKMTMQLPLEILPEWLFNFYLKFNIPVFRWIW